MADELICLVISLTRSAERRQEITARLNSIGIPFRFVDGIDAAAGFSPEQERLIDYDGILKRRGNPMGKGEIACAMSHAKAYQTFLDSDADYALILEDDAIPGQELVDFLEAKAYRQAPMFSLHHTKARVFRSPVLQLIPGVVGRRLGNSPFYAVAYTLNRTSAAELLKAATPVRDIADWPMDLSELGAYVTVPNIVGHPPPNQLTQSLITVGRSKPKVHRLSRLLKPSYWHRKWRKIICEKIS